MNIIGNRKGIVLKKELDKRVCFYVLYDHRAYDMYKKIRIVKGLAGSNDWV